MTIAGVVEGDGGTVRDRLIRAASDEIEERGTSIVQMEAVAKRAGVSRATAFRRLGSVSEVVIQVALLRGQRHIAAAHQLMQTETGVFAKLEAALIYAARELPADPSIAALIAGHSASVNDPRVHAAAVGMLAPALQEGQRHGEVRTDLELDELVDFLVEQTYLAAEDVDRSEEAVRKRFRHFVVPALESRGGDGGQLVSHTREVDNAISTAVEALQRLASQLHIRREMPPTRN